MLVESVPNVSEGRRLDVIDRLVQAITSVPGVYLLDRTSDASHNRSVFTLAGEHEAVADSLERLLAVAIHDIDMGEHEGEHPRIGAVDVIPFIPLAATSMDDCVDLAHAFGERVAARFELPVYFYARETDSTLMLAIAYAGFFINLFNMIPVSPFDGGRVTAVLSPPGTTTRTCLRTRPTTRSAPRTASPMPRPTSGSPASWRS